MTNDAERTPLEPTTTPRRWFHLSQETLAIVGSAIALATLMLTATGNIRDEARAARVAWEAESRQIRAEIQSNREAWEAEARQIRAENRADRKAWEAESRQIRDENRAAREAWEAESRHFQSEILRLTRETARLGSRDAPE